MKNIKTGVFNLILHYLYRLGIGLYKYFSSILDFREQFKKYFFNIILFIA